MVRRNPKTADQKRLVAASTSSRWIDCDPIVRSGVGVAQVPMVNAFVLNACPHLAAAGCCDQHAIKIAIEACQLATTALRMRGKEPQLVALKDGQKVSPYKSAYPRHPMTLWTAACQTHWWWMVTHGLALCDEYSRRFQGKTHATRRFLEALQMDGPPDSMPLVVDVEEWRSWMTTLVWNDKPLSTDNIDSATARVARANPPLGARFGMVCFKADAATLEGLLRRDKGGEVDCIESHKRYYQHKTTQFQMRFTPIKRRFEE